MPLLSLSRPEYIHRTSTRNIPSSSSSPYLYSEISGNISTPANLRQLPPPSSAAPATTIQHQAWVGSLFTYCDASRELFRTYSSTSLAIHCVFCRQSGKPTHIYNPMKVRDMYDIFVHFVCCSPPHLIRAGQKFSSINFPVVWSPMF